MASLLITEDDQHLFVRTSATLSVLARVCLFVIIGGNADGELGSDLYSGGQHHSGITVR